MTEIVETEGVLGGKPRLDGTRISVLQIAERVLDLDQSPEHVADQLDISLGAVHAALAYYYEHIDEMRAERERTAALEAAIREDAIEPPERVTK